MKRFLLVMAGLRIVALDRQREPHGVEYFLANADPGTILELDELPTRPATDADRTAGGAGVDATVGLSAAGGGYLPVGVAGDSGAAEGGDRIPIDLLDYMIAEGKLVSVSEEILAAREREITRAALWQERETLKRALASTDHKSLQHHEGDISDAEFDPIRTTRDRQRTRIREITKLLESEQ